MKKRTKILLLLGLAAVAIAIPATAFAWSSVVTYAHDRGYAGFIFSTAGYGPRAWNRVYHDQGTLWDLNYCPTSGSCTTWYVGQGENPTVDPRDYGYGQAECYNLNDVSGVYWTCQTTTG